MSNKIGLCKYCWEVLCSQCQENLIDDDNDHVSKSELRAWCEEKLSYKDTLLEGVEMDTILELILEKFCKGEK